MHQCSHCILYISAGCIVFKLAMWKMLLALPSPNTLEEYWLRITPYQDLMGDLLCGMPVPKSEDSQDYHGYLA